jgi:hypothetical protein
MIASPSARGIFVSAEGRWNAPLLASFCPDEGTERDLGLIGGTSEMSVGLRDVAHYGVADDDRGLVFLGDSQGAKAYNWWDTRA